MRRSMSARKYNISEIFFSLQGEGFHTGLPAVFVRMSGCDLHCPWCDTDFSTRLTLTADAIAAEADRLYPPYGGTRLLVLTGGEPTLQADEELTGTLHGHGFSICIETNGTRPVPRGIDWVTCSPKAGSAPVLTEADEVKVVYTGDSPEHWRQKIKAPHWLLQPLDNNGLQNTQETVAYILKHPGWRLSLQTHKAAGFK